MADETLLRKIFAAHSKTPKEVLYTETGNVPVRFILMGRRLVFLWYLLHEEKESLLSMFFHAQLSSPGKGDWVLTVQEDIVNLELSMDLKGITAISQSRFKSVVKHHVKKKAFEYLQSLQATHSKSKVLKYSELKLQAYLQPGTEKLTIQEKQFAFRARTRTLDLLGNFKTGKLQSLWKSPRAAASPSAV